MCFFTTIVSTAHVCPFTYAEHYKNEFSHGFLKYLAPLRWPAQLFLGSCVCLLVYKDEH